MWGAIFPGQGSQNVGMGKFLIENFTTAKRLFEEASDTLHFQIGKLCFEGPESDLTLTENLQPALLLVSTATFVTFQEETGFQPSLGAGHSLGEYSALTSAGTLKFADALLAVRARGKAMQTACPQGEGAMAAVIGWEDEDVTQLCAWVESTSKLSPLRTANFNSPGQVVISGRASAVTWLKENYSPEISGFGKKLKMIPLNVSAPFHCPLMKPAEDTMKVLLTATHFEIPRFPIVQNTTAMPSENPDSIREELIKQVTGSVNWAQSIRKFKDLGVSHLIEFGPGKVLAGPAKKTDAEFFKTFNLQTMEDFKTAAAEVR